jgi:fatty-acyl-CoA synthase
MPYTNSLRSVHQRILWSYTTLKESIEALACGLVELGLRPGDAVGLINPTTVEHVNIKLKKFVSTMACAKAGATLVEFRGVNNANDLT